MTLIEHKANTAKLRNASRPGTRKRGLAISTLLLLMTCTAVGQSGYPTHRMIEGRTRRPVTVTDAIQMTTLGDRLAVWNGAVAQFSPNGGCFVVVLKTGNLVLNTNAYSLLLWKSASVFRSPAPRTLLTLSSSSNRAAIQQITWLDDNETILFLGEHPGELHQLYAFNTRTRILKRLTTHPTNLIWYSATPDGRTVAYTAEEPTTNLFSDQTRRQGLVVSTQTSYALSRGVSDRSLFYSELFIVSRGQPARRILTEGAIPSCCTNDIALSPDAHYVAVAVNPAETPTNWQEYSDEFIQTASRWKVPKGQFSSLRTYELVDTKRRTNRRLLNVPLNSHGWQLVWSPDSQSVAIGGTYLPLRSNDSQESQRSRTFTVEVAIADGQVNVITEGQLRPIGWDKPSCVALEVWNAGSGSERKEKMNFCRTGRVWRQSASVPESQPEIVLRQSMNLAPELYALNPQSLRETALLDLNPQFALMKFARVEEIQWRGTDGQLDKGGLYYPVDYSVGKRYPLVIQTHDWSPDQFLIDGPFTTAFAAQPLAGLGIMVLQTGQITSEFGKPGELTSNMSMFEGAIDDLDERGLIDRNHVGIIGFSRTCLHVKYALAHSRYRFEAASVTDGFDAGYLQYILALPSNSGFTEDVEDINGGAPFGNLERWMQRSVGFVVSQVRTPLRINALTNTSVLGEWEWFAALSRLSRPVEMVVIEDGSHLLEKPWDREISQQGNVDWFRFWLRNEEDPDPTKADQYSRWRELRNLERY